MFKEAVEIAKAKIGARRERLMLESKHSTSANRFLAYWIRPYKGHVEWESHIKNVDAETGGNKVVVIEKFPDSPDVPALAVPALAVPALPKKDV